MAGPCARIEEHLICLRPKIASMERKTVGMPTDYEPGWKTATWRCGKMRWITMAAKAYRELRRRDYPRLSFCWKQAGLSLPMR
jgi:hypothetical protein